jgi:hypothetical protein
MNLFSFLESEQRSVYRYCDTGWTIRGSNPDSGIGFLFSGRFSLNLWPTELLISREPGLFLGCNWRGCEVDHSHVFSAEIRNEWSYT